MFLGFANYTFHRIDSLEKELEELFDEVKRMISMGNKNDAIDLLTANYEVVKERLNAGTKGTEEAVTLDIIAPGYMAVGDLKFVGSLLNMVFPLSFCYCTFFSHFDILYNCS